MTAALIVIDVQQGFTDSAYWGPRNNPHFESNLDRLLQAWIGPVVVVRHDSVSDGSPLEVGQPGNDLVASVAAVEPALLVTKSVNSAFYGEPDLQSWLQGAGVDELVICGIQTNMCVETTARMAGNLGYDVTVAIDATHTFDLEGSDGSVLTADELSRATAVNLSGGGFATVASTAEVLAAL
jgi:nicotinamidase-related amidase